jgi:Kdo2-lipid IVA lauroyltransferase/acyltransferase
VLLLSLELLPPPVDVPASPLARAAVRLLLSVLGRLSPRARAALARTVGRLAFALGLRRRLTLEQLAWAFPSWTSDERQAVARRTFENMARAGLDALLSQKLSPTELAGLVQAEDGIAFEKALAAGRGLLLVTAHFGSWELLGEAVTRQGLPLNAVVRPLKGAFNAEVVAGRLRSGMRLLPQRHALRGALAVLRRNEVVTVLLDQAVGGKHALFVPFFGRPAATTPLVSMAALRSGAPVLLSVGTRVGTGFRLRVEGPFPVPSTGDRARDLWTHTATLTAAIERLIRSNPDQWLWLHRRWKVAPPKQEALRLELLALAADDEHVRSALAASGQLFQGYAPEMEALHRRNAAKLAALVDAAGWPGLSSAGADGEEAAFLVLQHAISEPELQRRYLPLLTEAAALGEAPALQPAMLLDRIRFFEGRPQRYGTSLDWDAEGRLTPGALEAPGEVDARRASVGLPPLAASLEESLLRAAREGQRPPTDIARRRAESEAWARRVGWRK